MARARYEEKKLDAHRSRAGRTVQSLIVLCDDGDEDEDDTGRLSELIALAEAGIQAQEADDDTGRLSELISLAEAGIQTQEADDDTGRLSKLIALAEAGLQAEEDDDAFFTQAAAAADEAEAAYYRRQRATQVSLATATRLWSRIGTRTTSCLLSMFLTEGFLLRRLLVSCFINDQCSYAVEILLCCLIFHLNY